MPLLLLDAGQDAGVEDMDLFASIAEISFMMCAFQSTADGSCAALASTCAVGSAEACSSSDYSYELAACAAVGTEGGDPMSQANCEAADPGDTCVNTPGCTCVYSEVTPPCEADATALAAAIADRTGATMALHFCVLQGAGNPLDGDSSAREAACNAVTSSCVSSASDEEGDCWISSGSEAECEAAAGACQWMTEPSKCEWSGDACVATSAYLAENAEMAAGFDALAALLGGMSECTTPGEGDCSCTDADMAAMAAMSGAEEEGDEFDLSALSSGCLSCSMASGGDMGLCLSTGGCTAGSTDPSCTCSVVDVDYFMSLSGQDPDMGQLSSGCLNCFVTAAVSDGDDVGDGDDDDSMSPAVAACFGLELVRKCISFAPFLLNNDHFAKTGSGQT